MEHLTQMLLQYGVLGAIALVFFTGYFEDRKDTKEWRRQKEADDRAFNEKMVEHEKEYLLAIVENKRVIEMATEAFTSTQEIHQSLDAMVRKIDITVEEAKKNTDIVGDNQKEIIKTLGTVKDTVEALQNEIDIVKALISGR